MKNYITGIITGISLTASAVMFMWAQTKNFGDITKIKPKDIPDFDLFTGGFPCQPFSQVGMGLGEDDTRGTLFHDIIRICKVKKPKHILLENVKGLKTSKHGRTLKTIITKLTNLGYDVVTELMNSKDYGIPQNRERVWIYAYKGILPLTFKLSPVKKKLNFFFKDLLDKNPDQSLFKNQKQIKRLKELYNLDFEELISSGIPSIFIYPTQIILNSVNLHFHPI